MVYPNYIKTIQQQKSKAPPPSSLTCTCIQAARQLARWAAGCRGRCCAARWVWYSQMPPCPPPDTPAARSTPRTSWYQTRRCPGRSSASCPRPGGPQAPAGSSRQVRGGVENEYTILFTRRWLYQQWSYHFEPWTINDFLHPTVIASVTVCHQWLYYSTLFHLFIYFF